jgi:hypothetical protein
MESTDTTTQQLMFSLIEIWKGSGKTQQDFCKQKDIAYGKFHYWLRKYNVQGSTPDGSSGFMDITVKNRTSVRGGLEQSNRIKKAARLIISHVLSFQC